MSKFVTPYDYDATVHWDILDALIREDSALIEICEDRAIAEMRSYLSKRYDCDAIFGATGDARNQLIHNPQKLSQVRKDRYERAVAWMKAVASEDISIDGAPLLPEEERAGKASVMFKSNPKRENRL